MKWRDWDINLKIRLIGEGLFNLLFWMFFPFMAIYFSEVFGQRTAGLLLTLAQLFSAAIGLMGGYFSDHYGRKRMMVLSAACQAVCFCFFALANAPWFSSPVITFISFTMLGVFGQLYHPAASAMIADIVAERYRARVFAVFYTLTNICVVIGPLLGGLLFFKHRFLTLILCFVVCAAIALLLAKKTHETAPLKSSAQAALPDGRWYDYLGQQLADMKKIVTDRLFVLYILAGILVAQTFMQLDLLIAIYSANHVPNQTLLGFGSWNWTIGGSSLFSLMVSLNGLIVALLTVVVCRWMERFNERGVFMCSAFFYGTAMILIGSTVNAWMLLLAVGIMSWAEVMTVGVQDSFIAKIAPLQMRGQYYSFAGLRFSIGRSIAPLSLTLAIWVGYFHAFLVLAAIAFVGMALYGYIFTQYEKSGLRQQQQKWVSQN
ncbi:MDR family MFS transporter [Sporolactobacillus spathodeae]|uniref:MFS family permease n=1 Tax=Sporolactobacillus spathodeae TaxID=1465502 RepID=A0ABS2Q9Y4_9BACL|nr:MFS transporter [Sporolactobacillus spathodeae]MBM7658613.1 MFS family permease [Sporolactobacillus spathodeae]